MSSSERTTFAVAKDVGGIELISASLHRRGAPPHIHDEYSISVSLRGGIAFDHRGSKQSAPTGIVSCIAPGEVHNGYAARGDHWVFVNMLVPQQAVREMLEQADSTARLPDIPKRVIADPATARQIVALHELLSTTGDLLERQSTAAIVLTGFFERFSTLRCRTETVGVEQDPVRRARELLHDRFMHPIPLKALASYAGLSPYHFLRTFRKTLGMTPHVYLNQVRAMEAKRMLAAGMPAAEVALACGFYDQSHMARQFKRAVFLTPGQYKSAFGRGR